MAEFECPIDVPVSVLGGKWKMVLLFYVLQRPRRPGELQRLVPGISQKMLTQQLRELEADGLIFRTVHEQVPPKVVYTVVAEERHRLAALLEAMCEWGLYWADRTNSSIRVLTPLRPEA